ncbi:hypothetical protein B0H16DRAFT_1592794 [Mycena metata]|uniref:F-box domain-containing protein n=1 Tax=Mycena metata TaxID=1033252 RepID=A0AAD7HR81_9AGAR|nr:hypothetical protein B0H16DRAFT_1592794 [Mycena metata]
MTSPLISRLGTNYCPTDEEVPQIWELLVNPSSRLKQLDDKIAGLQKALDKLVEERASLGAFVEAHKALLSPIRRLPPDVIQEIFAACLPTHRNCVMSASEAPVLLGRICSSWRAISLTTTRLWTRLHVVWPPRPIDLTTLIDAKIAQRVAVLETWLGRSGQLPLSISVQGYSPHLLQALLPFFSRLQHIQFITTPPSFEPLSHITEADVPMLETIAVTRLPFRPDGWGEFAMFRGPRITGFTASVADFATGNLPLQWHKLTILKMESGGNISSHKLLTLLLRCPELRICRLWASDFDGTPHSPVGLEFLHTLELAPMMRGDVIAFLLDRLSLPELRNFSIAAQITDQHNLPGYLTRWTKLEGLEIGENSLSASSWVACLRSLPETMRRLVLRDTAANTSLSSLGGSRLETALTALELAHGTPLCPALEELHIPYTSALSDAALLRFITRRMVAVSPPTLRRVEVKFQRPREVDILPDLQPFIDEGLRVSLTYLPPLRLPISPWQGLLDAPKGV